MSLTYKSAGVDIAAAEQIVRSIKPLARETFSPLVLREIGHFSSFVKVPLKKFLSPVIVASTDGVGTKLKIAFESGNNGTIGQDLVNHCVNDVAVSGATPLFCLDYFATGKLSRKIVLDVIKGIATACKENSVSLVGGETAEMPGLYKGSEYDLAGTVVGIVEQSEIIDGSRIKHGDVLIGIPSSGLHTNGFSLVRKVLLRRYRLEQFIPDLGTTLVEELLRIHRSYLKLIRAVIAQRVPRIKVGGISHITGGGIEGNTRRLLPKGKRLKIDWGAWERPPIFQLIQQIGKVSEPEMRKTFNLGIGLIFIVAKTDVDALMQVLRAKGEKAFICGEIS